MSSVTFDTTKASNYLKSKFGDPGVTIYNSFSPTLAMLPKDYDWQGGNFEEAIAISMGVGVGSGSTLPDAAVEQVVRVNFSDKNMYARSRIANKLIEKAVGGETAFIDAEKSRWEKLQKGWAWNIERCLFNDGSGQLGTITSVVNTDPTFVCTMTNSASVPFKVFNFEVGILVNVNSPSGTDVFEVTGIDISTAATPKVTLRRQSGSQVPAGTNVIYMQNSYNNDILGFKSVTDIGAGVSLYGVTTQYRWMPHQQLNIAQTIDEELIDNAVLDIEANCGEGIDYIVTARKQWKILKSSNVGLKRYLVPNPNVPDKFAARFGFTALEYYSPVGSKLVPIAYSRFCEDDRMTLLNTKKCKLKHTSKPHFFDRDGTVFMRTPDNKDDLEARWVAYMELFMYPTYHGVITGLS